jgi:microcystin-dependent protein
MSELTGLSETDASNTSITSASIAEGGAPSALNNAIRNLAGALTRSYNRLTGKYASTGSDPNYVLTPSVALPAYVTGERYSFRANFSNTTSATLNISTLGAKTIKKYTASGTAALAANDIRSGQPVTVEYDGTDMIMVTPVANTLTDSTALALVPTGAVSPYAGLTEPTGWLFCYGQAVSRSTYTALFTAISTTYGIGDGSTTFNLPDLRGRVVAGQDDMGGTSANRLTLPVAEGLNGDTLGATGGEETHTLTVSEMPAHTHAVGGAASTGGSSNVASSSGTVNQNTSSTGGGGAHNNVQPTIILNYIIKT